MKISRCCGLAALVAASSALLAQTDSHLSAREVFYLAQEAASKAPAKPAVDHPAQRQSASVINHVRTPTHSVDSAAAPVAQNTTGQDGTQLAQRTESNTQAHISLVVNKQYPPLGLRYAIYRVNDGGKEPVDADTVFHSNDHIQFTINVSAPGYLYVITRGASGRWSTLFPASGDDPSSAHVEPNRTYSFPPGQVITFTEPAGKEEVFLFLSRQPVRSTEDLMLQISNGKGEKTALPQENVPSSNVIEAFNRMDDNQVNLLRTSYSRDLIVEKVNSDSPQANAEPAPASAPEKDNSVYVVNPNAGQNAHVVADITFRHE